MRFKQQVGLAIIVGASLTLHMTGAAGPASPASERFIVVARAAKDRAALRAEVQQAGGTIVRELKQIRGFVVAGPSSLRARVKASAFASGIAVDRINRLIPTDGHGDVLSVQAAGPLAGGAIRVKPHRKPDPAFGLRGLLWNFKRIHAPEAWHKTLGSGEVTVGVADTGIDFTHADLRERVAGVVDFTATEDPPLCQALFGLSDQDLANLFPPGPVEGDWNGHGTWVGGTIGAALDREGFNGIAPRARLVSLKISQWCQAAYDSTVLEAILYAADNGIDVLNLSFGSYRDLSNPDEALVYAQYVDAVGYASARGTTIVASAGNEHVRIGPGGRVLSRGSLTTPGAPVVDLFGLFQVPGGIPGVIDVAATSNKVNHTEHGCPAGTTGSPLDEFAVAECKQKSDRHQPFGAGKKNQLAYYSNYGPRIDIAAPGGARKFNLPGYDRGGTPGWPWTTEEEFNAWEIFSTTSNWSVMVPCFLIDATGFQPDQCYSSLQGTSMAAPHVSAVLALMASARPALRHKPLRLTDALLDAAHRLHENRTPPLSASDVSAGDLSGIPCPTGFCHLGGRAIQNYEAFGAGLLDAHQAVHARGNDRGRGQDHDHGKDHHKNRKY